ncbi:hypothetical protein Tco_1408157 [Tanacetum coccineum]
MVPAATSLVGFSGEIKWPLGQITLLVKVGDDEHSTSTWMDFMVVRSTSLYNGIIGRPGLQKMKAVPSTTHGMIKFPVMGGTLTLRSSKIIPIECATVSEPEDQPPPVNKVEEERIKVAINPEHTEQIVRIGLLIPRKSSPSQTCDYSRYRGCIGLDPQRYDGRPKARSGTCQKFIIDPKIGIDPMNPSPPFI